MTGNSVMFAKAGSVTQLTKETKIHTCGSRTFTIWYKIN